MMNTVGAYEAKTHLSQLLDNAERGEPTVITRHGRPVATLQPWATSSGPAVDLLAQAKAIRAQVTATGPSVREMIEDGRR